jgi:transposase
LRRLLAEGRPPACRIPPAQILGYRALLELYHDLRAERTAQAQRRGVLPPGRPPAGRAGVAHRAGPGCGARRRSRAPVPGRAAASRHRPGHDRRREARLAPLRHRLPEAARHLTGAKVPAARPYGAGPLTALALTCRLAGKDRFSSSRKAARFAGLDITAWSSDRKGPPGQLSRQGPPVLRWAAYAAGETHARAVAPGHACDAAVKDRKNGKRATLADAQDRPAGLPHPGRARRRRAHRRLTSSPVPW